MKTVALLAALWLTLSGCGSPPARDEASADDTSTRIISLVPAVTEMLFAIGAGSDLVGVSSFDRLPAEADALPRVGALVDPDFERILTLRPTTVIVYWTQADLISRLERSSISTFIYQHDVDEGIADIPNMIRRLGEVFGRSAAAEALASGIEQELEDVRASVAGQPRPATALVFGREPGSLRGIYASAGVGFLHELLEIAGGRDVFGDIEQENLQVSTEVLLARRPEVIIELRLSTAATPETIAAERLVWNRLAALPAVRDNRVHILTDPGLAVPGPRIGATARAFRDAIRERVRQVR